MAQFAFGLTKAVIEGTVSKAKSAIDEEEKLKDEVQHDLEFITDEFQMMQSFLNNVTNRDRAGESEVARTWLRLLRDLAFDVEDWVEFVAHMEERSACAWCWRMLQRCTCGLMQAQDDLDLAAAEMKLLKARVENVSQRSMRYSLFDPSLASAVSKPAAAMPTEQMVASAANPFKHILRKVWEAAGKPCAMLNLKDIIATEGGQELQVVSVWGSTQRNLGMTSVIRKAYCDAQIRKEFGARAWVKLADPFNLHDFLDSLTTQLCKSRSHLQNGDGDADVGFQPVQWEEDDGLMKQLLLLMKKKYLIVLEDVSTVVQWDDIKMHLPDNKNGSRIVVSTHDIGMAFMCTDEPYYQVSELSRFPDGHAVCAFFRKAPPKNPIDVDEFIQKITCPSVVSVWGTSHTKSILIDKVYHKMKFKFETYGWVHVPDYWFDLKLISRQLYLDICSSGGSAYSETKHANETVDTLEETALIHECCKFLREKVCLVVIDGVRSTQDWDLFKDKFLSEPIKGCIIVITNEGKVAKHCAHPDQAIEALNIKDDLKANAAESFSIRKEEARKWTKTAQIVKSHQELALSFSLLLHDPGVVSVWGLTGVGKKYLVKTSYYHHMLRSSWQLFKVNGQHIWLDIRNEENPEEEFTAFSWVNVPRPFSLRTFSRLLLLDLYADDLQAMEAAAVGIMQGQDLYEECRKILHQKKKYFVVINGLQSTDDWDTIKQAFFPRRVDGCVVVITHEAKVARHCQIDEERRVNVKAFQADEAHNHFMESANEASGQHHHPDSNNE